MPGPAPSPHARRRNARPDWRSLPASGFDGEIPEWPLVTRPVGVDELWVELWRSPQAVVWAEGGAAHVRLVARYASVLLICEGPEATAALLSECRQLEDRLGLSPMAMKRLQWEIGEVPAAAVGQSGVPNVDEFADL